MMKETPELRARARWTRASSERVKLADVKLQSPPHRRQPRFEKDLDPKPSLP